MPHSAAYDDADANYNNNDEYTHTHTQMTIITMMMVIMAMMNTILCTLKRSNFHDYFILFYFFNISSCLTLNYYYSVISLHFGRSMWVLASSLF